MGGVVDLQVMYFNSRSILNEFISLEESAGKSLKEIYKEKFAYFIKMANDVISGREGKSFEMFFKQLNKFYCVNAFSSDGKICIFLAMDITEGKKSEKELKAVNDVLEIKVHKKTAELRKSNEELKQTMAKYKSTVKSLERNKEHYRQLVQNMPDIIVRIDKKLKGVFINEATLSLFEEITGIQKIDLMYKGFEELGLHGKTVDSLKMRIIEVFKTKERIDFEFKLETHAGLKYYHTYFIPEYDDYGNVMWVLTVSRDITNLKKSEEQSCGFFDVVNYSEDAIISLDLNGIIKNWNKGAEKIYRYSASEAIGNLPKILMDNDEWKNLEKNIKRIKNGQRLVHFHAQRITKYGNKINVSVSLSPIKNHEEKITGISIIARDITPHINAEKALMESELKFRELFNRADDMITLVELKGNGLPGKFIEVNDTASNRLGYSMEELLDITPVDIVAPEKRKEMLANAAELQKRKKARFEIVHLTTDGKKFL